MHLSNTSTNCDNNFYKKLYGSGLCMQANAFSFVTEDNICSCFLPQTRVTRTTGKPYMKWYIYNLDCEGKKLNSLESQGDNCVQIQTFFTYFTHSSRQQSINPPSDCRRYMASAERSGQMSITAALFSEGTGFKFRIRGRLCS
jgi:hypothetical protein